jgi:hypothetical protein
VHLFLAGAFVIYAFLVGVELQLQVSIEIGEERSRNPVLASDVDYDEKPQFGPFLGVCTAWTPAPEPAEVLLLPSPGGEPIDAPIREIQERPGFPLALLIPQPALRAGCRALQLAAKRADPLLREIRLLGNWLSNARLYPVPGEVWRWTAGTKFRIKMTLNATDDPYELGQRAWVLWSGLLGRFWSGFWIIFGHTVGAGLSLVLV